MTSDVTVKDYANNLQFFLLKLKHIPCCSWLFLAQWVGKAPGTQCVVPCGWCCQPIWLSS